MKAFTLIELLIVVAIIAILAAIAVPNFLEAQVRSKVSRAKADMRSLATALEAYAVDNNIYPPNDAGGTQSQFRLNKVVVLTTPIAYMTSFSSDPFFPAERVVANAALDGFQYFNYDYRYRPRIASNFYGQQIVITSWGYIVGNNGTASGSYDSGQPFDIKGACIKSWGPAAGKRGFTFNGSNDLLGDAGIEWSVYGLRVNPTGTPGINMYYDPTNGTISAGNLARFVGSVPVPQAP
jgi:prepilin-type N-terminal cleavage/methylation domain-containing protein